MVALAPYSDICRKILNRRAAIDKLYRFCLVPTHPQPAVDVCLDLLAQRQLSPSFIPSHTNPHPHPHPHPPPPPPPPPPPTPTPISSHCRLSFYFLIFSTVDDLFLPSFFFFSFFFTPLAFLLPFLFPPLPPHFTPVFQ